MAAVVVGCSSSPGGPPAHVVEAVQRASTPGAVHRLNEAAHVDAGASAPVLALATTDDSQVRRAAVYVGALWADDDDDQRALEPFLTDDDDAVRAMAAGALAGLGHQGGRAVLDALQPSTALMPWSDPPLTAGAFASTVLEKLGRAGR